MSSYYKIWMLNKFVKFQGIGHIDQQQKNGKTMYCWVLISFTYFYLDLYVLGADTSIS